MMNKPSFKTLPEVAEWNAKHLTASTYITIGERTNSFAQFNSKSNQVASGLVALGAQLQDRIAFLGKDSDWAYEILMGSTKAQAVFVPFNWRLTAPEISYLLQDAEAKILFVELDFLPVVEKIRSELPLLQHLIILNVKDENCPYVQWRNAQPAAALNRNYNEEDAAVQVYTSGTTGFPKGVQLAHYTFFRMLQGAKTHGDTWMELNESDVLLLGVPIFHIGGMWWNLQGFIAGASGVILETFIAWKALEMIEKYSITKTAMVPAMIQFCLSEPSCKTTDFSSLKYILYGGSPISPTLRNQAKETFGCDFFQIYGMTETGNCAVTLRPSDHDEAKRKNAAGRAFPGVKVKIVDKEGKELPSGSSGEIWIQSPSVMLGYWKNEQATLETLVDGWIKTGDGGYMDEEGFVYVCDRIKDMIIAAGENVFPAEVEAAISEHSAVKEVAVIGVPDELWGEAVKAIVVLNEEQKVSARELVLFARKRIADYKAPKSISFVTSLPRNAAGKVLKNELRKPFWENRERQVN